MKYTKFAGMDISTLGMGNMRLPTLGERGAIDYEKAQAIIDYAYNHGVNYFDTAFRYHGGESEVFIGKALAKYPRESWHLASKMPGHMMDYIDGKLAFKGYLAGEAIGSIGEIFEEQLKKCGVEYFDFYLLHNLCETSYDFYTNEELGVVRYLLEQKAAGRIRHLGFSAHGRAETIEKFLDKYDCFEFVQIQLNYMDWDLQDAKSKYALLEKRGLPVVVMEPVRGGKLANLPDKARSILRQSDPEATDEAWAFRFLQSLPGVKVVLSGMTAIEQIEENVALFSDPKPLNAEQKAVLNRALASMVDLVPCTACRYCCEGCPQGLDIPKLINMHNEIINSGVGTLKFTTDAMKKEELPSACLACGACTTVCPQGIDIPGIMKKLAEQIG